MLKEILDGLDVQDLEKLARIGNLLSGIGILLAGVAAWVTFFFFQRRDRDNKLIDGFRTLYAEFWKDPQISEARHWLTNNSLYNSKLMPVLQARLNAEKWENELSPEENEILEKVDLLCSIMVRIRSFEEGYMRYSKRRQRQLFKKVIGGESGIMKSIRDRQRLDLERYIKLYWPEIYDP